MPRGSRTAGETGLPDAFSLIENELDGNAASDPPAIAAAKNRANHTGVQSISTVTGLQDALDAKESGVSDGVSVTFNWDGSDFVTPSGVVATDANRPVNTLRTFKGGPDPTTLGLTMVPGDEWKASTA